MTIGMMSYMWRNTKERKSILFLLGISLFVLAGDEISVFTKSHLGLDEVIQGVAGGFANAFTLLLFFAIAVNTAAKRNKDIPPVPRQYVTIIVTVLIVSVVIAIGSNLATPEFATKAQHAYERYHATLGPTATILGTAILALFGYGLFVLKNKALLVYAYGEITFALTSCYVAIQKATHEAGFGTVTVVIASTYLVVRGLENRKKAIAGTAT